MGGYHPKDAGQMNAIHPACLLAATIGALLGLLEKQEEDGPDWR